MMQLAHAFLIGSLILSAGPARPEIRAVLVGACDYITLDADLMGPANDVRLMVETLVARGVLPAEMVVLTTDPFGLPAGVVTGKPFRLDILRAMAEMAGRSTAGDTLVFYFSGHGAQAPDMSGDEGGG